MAISGADLRAGGGFAFFAVAGDAAGLGGGAGVVSRRVVGAADPV
ncbi:hypothetical protein [Paracoccus alcaliphilus]|nr:hypothetical protein [Paracoccus alcaliphilus]